ncbi:hypothetical protein FOPE_01167 [Fonsecaea pedrosoi]|nr:hypothetical protein FOPE_01167 [Fonsecaea pedrosoi]
MAFLGDSIRGDGLMRLHTALAAIEEDFPQLSGSMSRSRFDHPPPPYASDLSGATTRSPSPNILTKEQQSRRDRRDQLLDERSASRPNHQFRQQRAEEEERIIEADRNQTWCLRVGESFSEVAYNIVKKRWVEQGIWSDKWTSTALGRWKHEEPLEIESDWETDPEVPPHFLSPRPKSRRLKSDDARRRIAERRAVLEREREASRPYYQFIYQISKERERMHQKATSGDDDFPEDINTRAYEVVKNTWHRRKIWNEAWGVMPGMSWKHEKPWDQAIAEFGLELTPPREVSNPAPVTRTLDQPGTNGLALNIGGSFPFQGNGDGSTQQESYGHTEPSGSTPSSTSNPSKSHKPRPRTKRNPAPRSDRNTSDRKDDKPRSLPGGPLDPMHSSRISKSAVKRNAPLQRQAKPAQALHDNTLPPAQGDAAASISPRRSGRIQLLKRAADNKMDGIASRKHQRRGTSRVKKRSTSTPNKARQ